MGHQASIIDRAFKCHVARRTLRELREASQIEQARALVEEQQRHIEEALAQKRLLAEQQQAEDAATAAAAYGNFDVVFLEPFLAHFCLVLSSLRVVPPHTRCDVHSTYVECSTPTYWVLIDAMTNPMP